jgi:hypothetical protein
VTKVVLPAIIVHFLEVHAVREERGDGRDRRAKPKPGNHSIGGALWTKDNTQNRVELRDLLRDNNGSEKHVKTF